jgi:glycosyltransferase involved in cell wall biosynthesis
MHVLHLESGRNLYGGARQVLHLIGGLAGQGVESTLVCPRGSAIAAAGQTRGLNIRDLPMHGDLDLGFILRFRRLIDELDPDVIHVHSRRGADTLGGLTAWLAGVPAVLSRRVDSRDLLIFGRLKYYFYQKVIAISERIYRQLTGLGLPASKLRLVRSAVDPAACRASWSREQFLLEFNLQESDFVVAVVAQLIARKGHRYLLEALAKITMVCPELRVIFFGRGPLEKRLKKMLARADLDSVVQFAGYREDLPAFLGHCQLLVHPAVREGLGLSLLEAQAAGVPVVGFRVAGVEEAVADGKTGILVAARDTTALAAVIAEIYDNPMRRTALAVAGPGWIGTEFSLESMVQGNLNIYRQILQVKTD